MAEITIENSLIECGICFELLDETCKMLPCQHTYCQKCLENIQQHVGCLRCPQCRTVVSSSVNSLPNNRILVNLIQEMKKKPPKSNDEDEELAKVITISLEEFMSQKATDMLLKQNEALQTQLALETSKQQSMIDSAKEIADEYEELVNLHLALGRSQEESQSKQQQNAISDEEKNLASTFKVFSDWFRIHNRNLDPAQKTEIQGILKDLIRLVGPDSDSKILIDTQSFLDELEAGCSSNSTNSVEETNQSKKVRNNNCSELIEAIERLTYNEEYEQKRFPFKSVPGRGYEQPYNWPNYLQSNNRNAPGRHYIYNEQPMEPQKLPPPSLFSPKRRTPRNMDQVSGSRGQGFNSYSQDRGRNPFFNRSHSTLNSDTPRSFILPDSRDYNRLETKSGLILKDKSKQGNRSFASSSEYKGGEKLILPDKRDYNNFYQRKTVPSYSSKQPEPYRESLRSDSRDREITRFPSSNENNRNAGNKRGFKNRGKGKYRGRNSSLNNEHRDEKKKSNNNESNESSSTSLSSGTFYDNKNKWKTNYERSKYRRERPGSYNVRPTEIKSKLDDIENDFSCSSKYHESDSSDTSVF